MGAAATPWQLEELRAVMQQSATAAWLGGWSAVVDDTVVGAGFIRTPLLDNPELAELDVHVEPDRQRQGHRYGPAGARSRRLRAGVAARW